MSEVRVFLQRLEAQGVKLKLVGENLKLRGPKGALTPELTAELKALKERVIELLHQRQEVPETSIAVVSREDGLPLSYAQQRLWFLERMSAGDVSYNIPAALDLRGELRMQAMERAIDEVQNRHEILRARFEERDGNPVQRIRPPRPFRLEMEDLSGLGETAAEERAHALAAAEAATPFDLEKGPLFRVRLLRLAPRRHVLLSTMHHIISDGWSVAVLIRELGALYAAFAAGRPSPLSALPIQYVDFAVWQRETLTSEALRRQRDYWRQHLAGAPSSLELPGDRPRPSMRSGRGGNVAFRCPPDLGSRIERLGRATQTTPFMVLQAAFASFLGRLSYSNDILVGTPTANRTRPEIEPLIGFFVNTLVLRNDLSPRSLTFSELLRRVRSTVLAAFEHGDLPFEEVVHEAQVVRDTSHSPLFQVMFTFTGGETERLALADLEVASFELENETAKFDLTLSMGEDRSGLYGNLEYSRDLFEQDTVAAIVSHFQVLVGDLLASPDQALVRCRMMGESERLQVLHSWDDTPRDYAHLELIPRQIAGVAASHPEAVAVSDDKSSFSYAELVRRANRLAHYLRRLGAGPEKTVGICMDRSANLVLAKLATWLSGAAYVPMDVAFPQERLLYIANDAGITVLIRDPELEGFPGVPTVVLERDHDEIRREPATPPAVGLFPEHAAYLIYTSGSTGKPKGVVVPHGALRNLAAWHARDAGLGPGQKSGLIAGLGFDVLVLEIWPYLASAAHVAVPAPETPHNAEALRDWIVEQGLRHCFVPTPMADVLFDMSWPSDTRLQRMVTAGDKLHRYPPATLPFDVSNHYGPTEATVIATAGPTPRGLEGIPDIGAPIDNYTLYILDEALELVPEGVGGQLYIGGAGLARGYHGRPARTASSYLPDHLGKEAGGRLYRTGDLVRRYRGRLEFHGRIDHQVKIRGVRIELGEIEATLIGLDAVHEAVAQVCEDSSGNKHLYAWCTVAPGFEETNFQQILAEKLPQFLVPRAVKVIERMPLTANGKFDRAALARDLPSVERRRGRKPRTPVEEILCSIFAEVLGVEDPGIDEDFFELGGHSLLATRVISRIEHRLGTALPLRLFFDAPTVAGLASRWASEGESRSLPPIRPVTERNNLPLSFAQQRLWFLDQVDKGAYLMPMAVRLDGPLDRQAMSDTIELLVRRHESLRTHFSTTAEGLVQTITDGRRIPWACEDLSDHGDDVEEVLARRFEEEARRPFDLGKGPLFRARLWILAPEEHVLLISMHHIITDGWSMEVFVSELVRVYTALAAGLPSPLPEPTLQYADYAVWQRRYLSGEVLDEQLLYWKRQLQGAHSLDLPGDRLPPKPRSFRGDSRSFRLDPDLSAALLELSRSQGVTPFMTLLAAFKLLLSRYCDTLDVVVASPIANRNRGEIESLIGFFVNTLVLRTQIDERADFRELLAAVRETTLAAWSHQDLPFEKLVEELAPRRDSGHTPFLNVVFTLASSTAVPDMPGDLRLTVMRSQTRTAKFDLSLSMRHQGDRLSGELEYSTDLFDGATIAAWSRHFQNLLAAIVAGPGSPVGHLSFLDPVEEERLVRELNRTEADFGEAIPVHRQLESQALENATATAVIHGHERLSYEDLNRRANRLAHYLGKKGCVPGRPVALWLDRSCELVVAQLAVLKCGAPYLPLDPSSPLQRIEVICEEAQPSLLITTAELADRLEGCPVPVRVPEALTGSLAAEPDENPQVEVDPGYMAYVIYTSGSTGRPKGVCVSHAQLAHLISWHRRRFAVTSRDKALLSAGVAFDASVWETWSYLCAGASLTIPSGDTRLIPEKLRDYLLDGAVTHAFAPTPIAERLISLPWPERTALRFLLTGGDKLNGYPGSGLPFVLVNHYGPTECTVVTTSGEVAPVGHRTTAPPLGLPIANTRIYVLDRRGRLQGEGIPGELTIAGAGLAMGYLDRAALTAAAFVPNPFSDDAGGRLYKTGDLVRMRRGDLEFLGRTDHQVKIRGFRVELGEIEKVLLRRPEVGEAVVLATHGNSDLAAYLVPAPGATVDTEAIRQALREELPDYMVPRGWVCLDRMPLTVNGKIDRAALPLPEIRSAGRKLPKTSTEKRLAPLFAEVLEVGDPGMEDDFFALGGHSLKAVSLLEKINAELGLSLPLAALLERPTVASLAALVDESDGFSSSSLVPLQPSGSRPPLFLVHSVGGTVLNLAEVARQLGPEQPVYGLQAQGLEAGGEPLTSYPEMARAYLGEIRRTEPRGPYYLGGYSIGGVIALEMAQQLKVLGEEVALLCLLDSHLPGEVREEVARIPELIRQELGVEVAGLDGQRLAALPAAERLGFIEEKIRADLRLPDSVIEPRRRRLLAVYLSNLEAHKSYPPRPYDGPTALFAAQGAEPEMRTRQSEAWALLTSARRLEVPGDHRTMLQGDGAAALAVALGRELARAASLVTVLGGST